MGLQQFEVRNFFGEKPTKFDLALQQDIRIRSKVVQRRSVMWVMILQNIFFYSKVIWENHSIEKFLW